MRMGQFLHKEIVMRRSWKTSIAGILGGILLAIGPQVGARLQGDRTAPPITLNTVLSGAALAALGLGAKDHNVSGPAK